MWGLSIPNPEQHSRGIDEFPLKITRVRDSNLGEARAQFFERLLLGWFQARITIREISIELPKKLINGWAPGIHDAPILPGKFRGKADPRMNASKQPNWISILELRG